LDVEFLTRNLCCEGRVTRGMDNDSSDSIPLAEIRNARKTYGTHVAVDNLTLSIPRGAKLGLLGPNGAGKTTTIAMIVGALRPDQGEIYIAGEVLTSQNPLLKRKIGYVPQEIALYDELSAMQNLQYFGALYDLKGTALAARSASVLEIVGLADRAKDRVHTFSGGMKRRLNIAVALLHEPELLILDEPTVGVDPQSRNAIFETIETLCKGGTTLLYTTHYMEEVERLCDQIAIMDNGKVLAEGTLPELRQLLPTTQHHLHLETAPLTPEQTQALQREFGERLTISGKEQMDITLEDLTQGIPYALQTLDKYHVPYHSLHTEKATLEDVFLHLTGKNLRDA
jgi:ABC-2 type transport system ATP-binding protein